MTKRRMKYNPSFLTETELVESFVVRHSDLEIIMGTINENVTDSNQHVLVIGPRGSGKTTLVHRVAAEIGSNPDLRTSWYPLIFSEESYEVVTAGEFWLEAMFHLSGQTGDEKRKRTYDELKSETDDQRLASRALSQLMDFSDSQGKRILLIVENLNMLFEDMTSDDEAWKIRHTLINEPRIMLLATATCRFEHIENSSQAMFEMFKLHELKPLDDDECNRIWEAITGRKLMGEQIKPLRILTGGNPRLLTIISKFSAHRSFRKLLDDLVDLIDDHTEYFKSHLDNLPPTERKVYLALAGLWDASTAREIAQAARLEVSKTSSLLGRLVNRGAVAIEEHGKKTKWYVVAERMYNIYYLMRRRGKPADRVKATVKFLVSMYDPESAARLIVDEACGLSPGLRQDHCLAYEATIAEISDQKTMKRIIKSTPQYCLESPYFNQNADDFALRKFFGHVSQITTKDKKACKLCKVSLKCIEEGYYEQAIDHIDKIIQKFNSATDVTLLKCVATAMGNKGFALRHSNRSDEAIAVYDELITRFKDADDAALREGVARAMVSKGLALGQSNRSDESIAVFDELITRFKDADDAALREGVARAMVSKGLALGQSNRSDESIAVYDELIARFKDADDAALREQVARAMVNKGFALGQSNRLGEEIAVYGELTDRFKDSDDTALREQVANAMFNKGLALGQSNRSDEAIAAYDEVIANFKDAAEASLREQVVRAMINKGSTLGQLDRSDEAIAVYDELIVSFKDAVEAALREGVARAMINKGNTLGQLDRSEEAIAVYDELIARFKCADETALRKQVAQAFFVKGRLLATTNKHEESEYCFRKAREYAPENIQYVVVLIELLLKIPERSGEALKTAEETVGKSPENPELLNGIAWAFYKHHDPVMLSKAAEWSEKAASLSPDKSHIRHTLACILSAIGKVNDALAHAIVYIRDTLFVERTIEDAIELFVELSASGQPKEALKLLLDSEASKHLEPIVVGIKIYIGEDVKTAPEIKEVAKDVVKRINARVEKRRQKHSE